MQIWSILPGLLMHELDLVLSSAVIGHSPNTRTHTHKHTHSVRSNPIHLSGGVIHIAMDGLVGGWHVNRLFDQQYRQLDNRFNDDVPRSRGGPTADAIAVGFLVSTRTHSLSLECPKLPSSALYSRSHTFLSSSLFPPIPNK